MVKLLPGMAMWFIITRVYGKRIFIFATIFWWATSIASNNCLVQFIRFMSWYITLGPKLSRLVHMKTDLSSFSRNVMDTSRPGGINLSMWNVFGCGQPISTISVLSTQYFVYSTSPMSSFKSAPYILLCLFLCHPLTLSKYCLMFVLRLRSFSMLKQ